MTSSAKDMNAAFAFQKWADIVDERLIKEYLKQRIGGTGQGQASISYSVSAGDGGGSATFFYNYYLMFVDMGVGKGQSIDQVQENKIARALEGRGAGGKRRPKQWYSPVMGREFFKLGPIMQKIYGNKAVGTVIEEIPRSFDLDL